MKIKAKKLEVEEGIDLSKIKTLTNGLEVQNLHIVEGEIWGERENPMMRARYQGDWIVGGWILAKWDLEGKDLNGRNDLNLKVEVEEEIVYLEVYLDYNGEIDTIEWYDIKELKISIEESSFETIAVIKWSKITNEKELINLNGL